MIPGPLMFTPWGTAELATRYAAGVWFVQTPSHGGFHVAKDRLPQMQPPLRQMANAGWFEEDCAWAAVAVAFPHLFKAEDVERAWQTLKHWEPEIYADLTCTPVVVPPTLQEFRDWKEKNRRRSA